MFEKAYPPSGLTRSGRGCPRWCAAHPDQPRNPSIVRQRLYRWVVNAPRLER
ncbi:hypothetical protein APASM_5536 [Actinosynnema pretiosum subsp. pretiosum]|nr:hypothetical protein APASM_5536 [Actinosynnema pretiosum subsp. pretiosum]